jgi:hypothetical protein
MLLRLAHDVNLMADSVRRVEGHMENVGDVDPQAVAALIPDALTTATATASEVPREAKALLLGCRQLTKATRDALLSAGDCARVRKASYLEHLRKLKDVSNAATRNAVLVRPRPPTTLLSTCPPHSFVLRAHAPHPAHNVGGENRRGSCPEAFAEPFGRG